MWFKVGKDKRRAIEGPFLRHKAQWRCHSVACEFFFSFLYCALVGLSFFIFWNVKCDLMRIISLWRLGPTNWETSQSTAHLKGISKRLSSDWEVKFKMANHLPCFVFALLLVAAFVTSSPTNNQQVFIVFRLFPYFFSFNFLLWLENIHYILCLI